MELCFLDLRQVEESQIQRWAQWLTPEERQRIAQYRTPLPHLCGRGLAREMLAEKLEIAPQQVTFSYGENGKPLVAGAYFNLSHSGDLVLCAVSDLPVGADVERLRAVKPHLCERFGSDEPAVFFQRWTETEARLKCCGAALGRWKQFMQPVSGYVVTKLEAPEGYAAAVCEKRE